MSLNTDYDIEKAFRAIEDELIASMIRNLDRHRAEETNEGYNWTQWQVEQLKALERYKQQNRKKFSGKFSNINNSIDGMINIARSAGGTEQEQKILRAMKRGFKAHKVSQGTEGAFFRLNTRKLDALIKATKSDFTKAEQAVLRMSEDKYRQIIFNAQVYAATGAGTYEKAVDMATKDFLSAGINCVEYKDGSRHTIKEYAKMAIKTANKRAYLTGEGEMRKQWGITTVIMNKRSNACPKCLPFAGKIFIDDVWSGGSARDGPYPLMSSAIAAGLYHPNCRDIHTTYFPELSEEPDDKFTKEELKQAEDDYRAEQKAQYALRQAEKFTRLAKYSLDNENKKKYTEKAKEWNNKIVDNPDHSDILNDTDTKEVEELHSVGKIDREIYGCITKDIVTDEVIITDNQIEHILSRHPEAYKKAIKNIEEVIKNPDYIIADKHENTGLVIKRIKGDKENIQLVLRICTSKDENGYKNSIISCWEISDKRLQNYLRNKQVLYRRE